MQIIHRKNLVLFESCRGTGKREEADKKAICGHIRPIHIENSDFIYSIRSKPKLLSDLLESTTASLFLDGGMPKCGNVEPLMDRCEELFDRLFGDDVEKRLVDGTLQFEVISAIPEGQSVGCETRKF